MKKVAILGFGESRNDAPFHDESYEIWGLNDLYDKIPRWNRWFDIHDFNSKDPNSIKTHQTNRAKLQKLAAYQEMTCPVYCQEAWPEIPNAVKYPLKEIQDRFCDGKDGYFTNQPSYMVALAIYEGFDVIELYGIDMSIDTEYSLQRPSVEYWLGIAKGMGKAIYVPPSSTLLKTLSIYGYEQEKAILFVEMYKAKLKYLQDQRTTAANELDFAKTTYNQYTGIIGVCEKLLNLAEADSDIYKEIDSNLKTARGIQSKSAVEIESCKTRFNQYAGAAAFCETILKEWSNV